MGLAEIGRAGGPDGAERGGGQHGDQGFRQVRQVAGNAVALADTGSVSPAAAMVNMSPEGAYYLRRQAGAERQLLAASIACSAPCPGCPGASRRQRRPSTPIAGKGV